MCVGVTCTHQQRFCETESTFAMADVNGTNLYIGTECSVLRRRRGCCSGNNNQEYNLRNRSDSATTVTKLRFRNTNCANCSATISTGIRSATRLLVSVEWWALDDPGISSNLRLCTSSHVIQDSRFLLLSVCQAPSDSSFVRLRLHELCTSKTLRLLLL